MLEWKGVEWIDLVQDGNKWRGLVQKVIIRNRVSECAGNT